MKKTKVLMVICIGIAILFSVAQIAVNTALTTDGIGLSSVQEQTQALTKENQILGEQVYTQSSLTSVVARAQKLGLEDDQKARLAIDAPAPIAFKQ